MACSACIEVIVCLVPVDAFHRSPRRALARDLPETAWGRRFDAGRGSTRRRLTELIVGLGNWSGLGRVLVGVTSPVQEDLRPPRRPGTSRRVAAVGVGVLLLAAAVAWS